ncbi:MAG: type II toxin-antitoxin system VapC family toxin [Pseudomonadota bacterium]|nr:type II toxin-antitoxin system VapC family toxin [Pseudomonadota bacterium]
MEQVENRHRLLGSLALGLVEPDWDRLPALARRWQLSAYNAAYLEIALARNAPLVTLDARLAAAWEAESGTA